MKRQASVLIVVLGLLAVLAIVGIAFVTMTNIDRNTAANFALQSQFDLAADGAVDYVCHYLVTDVWEFNTTNVEPATRNFTGLLLPLTGKNSAEPFDYVGMDTAAIPPAFADPWLASQVTSSTLPMPMIRSFQSSAVTKLYGMSFGGVDPRAAGDTFFPNNLGFPGLNIASMNQASGFWIADLAFPYEMGVICVSLTVQDHAALINVNAHGNDAGSTTWTFKDCRGLGFFVSDVSPPAPPFPADLQQKILVGDGQRHGRWGLSQGDPGNPGLGEVYLENPKLGVNTPFGLDDEFELRKLSGTNYVSRMESFWTQLDGNPKSITSPTASQVTNRLAITTVGWTAEVRGDGKSTAHRTWRPTRTPANVASSPKADINFDSPQNIYEALTDGRALNDGNGVKQFAANVAAFREKLTNPVGVWWGAYSIGVGGTFYGAKRQVFFTQLSASPQSADADGNVTWTVKAQLFNPWPGNGAGQTAGLNTSNQKVTIDATPKTGAAYTVNLLAATPKGPYVPADGTIKVPGDGSKQPQAPQWNFRLECTNPALVLDEVKAAEISAAGGGGTGAWTIHRPVTVERNKQARGTGADQEEDTVLYVGKIIAGGSSDFSKVNESELGSDKCNIPIRFPHSVSFADNSGTKIQSRSEPLPPRSSSSDYKAFARLGDLNQVMCPTDAQGGTAFWPWITRVAQQDGAATGDKTIKFDWEKDPVPKLYSDTSAMNAANVLTVNGPWFDGKDNDNDGKIDEADQGTETDGRFAGPEFRVAGKINLNTATKNTLDAIDQGLNLPAGTMAKVIPARTIQPLRTPAAVLPLLENLAVPTPQAKGFVEKRDEAWTRVSNIVSVRSDTFSIYGTVQFVDPLRYDPLTTQPINATVRLLRSRRFWALVDRSPSLAYPPPGAIGGSANFIHPRILNFQWMD